MRSDFKLQDDLTFVDDETGLCAGWVKPLKGGKGFTVHRTMTNGYEQNRVATVKSIRDALPALTAHYDENPPRWKRTREGQFDGNAGYTMYTSYVKWSLYGIFTIMQREGGLWLATRYMKSLLRDDQEATFPTAEVAKYVVDRHERDEVANYPALDDGYWWEFDPGLPGRLPN